MEAVCGTHDREHARAVSREGYPHNLPALDLEGLVVAGDRDRVARSVTRATWQARAAAWVYFPTDREGLAGVSSSTALCHRGRSSDGTV